MVIASLPWGSGTELITLIVSAMVLAFSVGLAITTLMPHMIDPSPWLRLVPPVLQAFLPKRSRVRLIFIKQPGSGWTYLNEAIQLHLWLHVTNDSNTDVLIVSRTQVRVLRAGWKFLFSKDPWQDCMIVDIGDQRLIPGFVGVLLPARTTAVFTIRHHYRSERPEPHRPIKCRLRITDQFGRLHHVRLTVPGWPGA